MSHGITIRRFFSLYDGNPMASIHNGDGRKVLALNKKARFNYEILQTFEAGIVLTGAEIKSVRLGKITLSESFVRPEGGELWLLQAYIAQYSHDSSKEYDPQRKRKLLMKKKDIFWLQGRVEQKGLTIVPLQLYLSHGFAKIEIALARGKDAPDKRETIKSREASREAQRAMKMRSR